MDFRGQYLTYDEYQALGGALDITPFNILEFEARRKVDVLTFNRLKQAETIPDEVKMCIYSLINSINNYYETTLSIANKGNVASENIDGYSVSYITAGQVSDIIKSKEEEIDNIIVDYLTGVIVNGEHIVYIGMK